MRNRGRKRRRNRKRAVVLAYLVRGVCFFIMTGMVLLMICGCMFIANVFSKDKVNGETTAKTGEGSEEQEKQEETIKINHDKIQNLIGTKNFTIVLDAGHGGKDRGTESGAAVEKEINLQVVLKMKTLFEEMGVHVILTRDSDRFMSLEERVVMGNEANAMLFVSIHCNYFEDDETVKGLECYYYDTATDAGELGESILQNLAQSGKILTRNVKAEDFFVLRETEIPAILIELGFLSNIQERNALMDDRYQDELAEELVLAIAKSGKMVNQSSGR